jgi:hypothetical protein
MIPTLNSWRLNNDENESLKRRELFFGQKKKLQKRICVPRAFFIFIAIRKKLRTKFFFQTRQKLF